MSSEHGFNRLTSENGILEYHPLLANPSKGTWLSRQRVAISQSIETEQSSKCRMHKIMPCVGGIAA